ncbi:MAG: ABC transporter ATP-binding protein [Devosiaceae bacterium]|nr:ABC transporter ATP-binding protein [Devosiaceae bacterium MH13]
MSVIRASDVAVRVGDTELFAAEDLTLRAGELTAIVGPNGAGKTSFLRALLGLIDHTGSVTYGAQTRDALSLRDRARFAAYLPQGQSHAWPLPVRDVVALGRFPHGDNAKQASEIVEQALARLGLSELADRSVLSLSGGEQMRVALARTLVVGASFLLVDEPLASLDPHYQFALLDQLRAEADAGVGVVMVLHDLRLAARAADRLLVIADGQITADGSPADVMTQGLIAKVFGVATRLEEVATPNGMASVALPEGSGGAAP